MENDQEQLHDVNMVNNVNKLQNREINRISRDRGEDAYPEVGKELVDKGGDKNHSQQ